MRNDDFSETLTMPFEAWWLGVIAVHTYYRTYLMDMQIKPSF